MCTPDKCICGLEQMIQDDMERWAREDWDLDNPAH